MINLTISAVKSDPLVNYSSPHKVSIGKSKEEKVLFLAENLRKEVLTGSRKQQARNVKKLKKLIRGFTIVGAVAMKTSPKAMAATAAVTTPPAGAAAITPALVMTWGLNLALISVALGVSLSMVMLSIAGIYRMFRKREMATEWSTDVIKGLVQVLIAVPTVYLLFYLAQMVFKNLPVLNGLF